jgi:hypothetical protein
MDTDLRALIQRSASALEHASDSMGIDAGEDDPNATWQLAYHALTPLGKVYRTLPDTI